MAQSRTLFIPWNRDKSGSFATEHTEEQREGTHHKRKVTVICRDTPGKPLADVGAGFGTRIHVVGHGAIGDPELGADHGTGGADVGIEELVDMMFDKGLKKHYLGTIACDVCYSALGNPSYAKLLARELYRRGLKASCVLGYKGPLYSTYRDRNAGSTMTSNLTGKEHKYFHRVVEADDGTFHKSKDMQERFWGFN